MSSSEQVKKAWAGRVPQGFVTLTEAARIIGRDVTVVRRYSLNLGVLKTNGKGQPALVKIADLEGLKEVMREVPKNKDKEPEPEPKPKPKESKPEPPKWTEPVLLAPSPEKEFERAVRQVLHLMERLGIDSITMQDGKAEMLRTVSVTKKEEIKG